MRMKGENGCFAQARFLYNCGINYTRTARKLLSEHDITSVNSGGKSSNTVSLWSYAVLSTLNGTRPFMLTKSNATYNSPPANSRPRARSMCAGHTSVTFSWTTLQLLSDLLLSSLSLRRRICYFATCSINARYFLQCAKGGVLWRKRGGVDIRCAGTFGALALERKSHCIAM